LRRKEKKEAHGEGVKQALVGDRVEAALAAAVISEVDR
jgi:hypothetical protein